MLLSLGPRHTPGAARDIMASLLSMGCFLIETSPSFPYYIVRPTQRPYYIDLFRPLLVLTHQLRLRVIYTC
ncbi:hypothetical protein CC78DRAFT_151099 [Lojkania enalia]|uniref:Uncharacterized protein n=1 Tax=Lojkania enalia TaxID=147567 RepID=A0A9P4N0U4_9PLEO|nr:hypothetical protein CC78DRAFT_151099 [Didymosphaeria enalia]